MVMMVMVVMATMIMVMIVIAMTAVTSVGGGGGLNSSMDRRDVLTRLSNPDDFYKLGKDYLCKQKQFMAETKPDPVLPNDCHTAENAGKLSTGN